MLQIQYILIVADLEGVRGGGGGGGGGGGSNGPPPPSLTELFYFCAEILSDRIISFLCGNLAKV